MPLQVGDVLLDVEVLDIVEGLLREGPVRLVERKPHEVVGTDLEGVWNRQSVVNWDQFLLFLTGKFIERALNQDVTCISIEIEEPQIKDCNFVNLIG